MKALLVVWALASAIAALPSVASGQELTRYRLRGADAIPAASRFTGLGFDVVEGSVVRDRLDIIASPAERRRLDAVRGKFVLDVVEAGGPLQTPTIPSLPPGQLAAFDGPAGYEDYDAIVARLRAIALANPEICELVDLTEYLKAPATAEERHIFAVKISDNVKSPEDEPAFLMVSAHHAREINTSLVSLDALSRLVGGYGADPAITKAVNENEIWIVPVWNPDGYQYVFSTERLWRKNRRPLEAAGVVGVDLNRNYPFDWEGECPGSLKPADETYRGPSASSEAETQTMLRFASRHRFAKLIDYHSYGRLVHWSYLCKTHPFDAFFEAEAAAIARAAQYEMATRPPAHGMNYQFHQQVMGSYAFLMETNTEFQPLFATAITEAQRIWPSTLLMLRRPFSISGHVRDSITGSPIAASIVFVGLQFSNGETFGSGGGFGRFDLIVPAGSYDLEISAPGYRARRVKVTTTADATQTIEVLLDKDTSSSDGAARDVGVDVPPASGPDAAPDERPVDAPENSATVDAGVDASAIAMDAPAVAMLDARPRASDAASPSDGALPSAVAPDEIDAEGGGCACALGASRQRTRSSAPFALLAAGCSVIYFRSRRRALTPARESPWTALETPSEAENQRPS